MRTLNQISKGDFVAGDIPKPENFIDLGVFVSCNFENSEDVLDTFFEIISAKEVTDTLDTTVVISFGDSLKEEIDVRFQIKRDKDSITITVLDDLDDYYFAVGLTPIYVFEIDKYYSQLCNGSIPSGIRTQFLENDCTLSENATISCAVPSGIRTQFLENDCTLSENATISCADEGQWVIEDRENYQKYFVIEKGDSLAVFLDDFRFLYWDGEIQRHTFRVNCKRLPHFKNQFHIGLFWGKISEVLSLTEQEPLPLDATNNLGKVDEQFGEPNSYGEKLKRGILVKFPNEEEYECKSYAGGTASRKLPDSIEVRGLEGISLEFDYNDDNTYSVRVIGANTSLLASLKFVVSFFDNTTQVFCGRDVVGYGDWNINCKDRSIRRIELKVEEEAKDLSIPEGVIILQFFYNSDLCDTKRILTTNAGGYKDKTLLPDKVFLTESIPNLKEEICFIKVEGENGLWIGLAGGRLETRVKFRIEIYYKNKEEPDVFGGEEFGKNGSLINPEQKESVYQIKFYYQEEN